MKSAIGDPPAPSALMVAGDRIVDGDLQVVKSS